MARFFSMYSTAVEALCALLVAGKEGEKIKRQKEEKTPRGRRKLIRQQRR
jgi:hypothetical protein